MDFATRFGGSSPNGIPQNLWDMLSRGLPQQMQFPQPASPWNGAPSSMSGSSDILQLQQALSQAQANVQSKDAALKAQAAQVSQDIVASIQFAMGSALKIASFVKGDFVGKESVGFDLRQAVTQSLAAFQTALEKSNDGASKIGMVQRDVSNMVETTLADIPQRIKSMMQQNAVKVRALEEHMTISQRAVDDMNESVRRESYAVSELGDKLRDAQNAPGIQDVFSFIPAFAIINVADNLGMRREFEARQQALRESADAAHRASDGLNQMQLQRAQLQAEINSVNVLNDALPGIVQASSILLETSANLQRSFVSLNANIRDLVFDIDGLDKRVQIREDGILKKDLALQLLDVCRGAVVDRSLVDVVWQTETTILYSNAPSTSPGQQVAEEVNKWPADIQNAVIVVDKQIAYALNTSLALK